MEKTKRIHIVTDIVAGYRAVYNAVDAVLSKTRNSQFRISAQHYAVIKEVYEYFTKTMEIYKLIVGTDGHTAHTDALVEVRFFTDNPNTSAPDARNRLFNCRKIIMDELLDYKRSLLELVKSL